MRYVRLSSSLSIFRDTLRFIKNRLRVALYEIKLKDLKMNEEDLEIYTWNETFNDDFNDETFGGGLSSNDNLPSFFTTKPTSNNTYNNKPKKSSSKNPSFRDLWNNDSAMPKAPFVSGSNDWDSSSLAPTQSTYSIFDSIKAPLDESTPLFSLDYQQPQQQFQNDQPKALTLEEVEASLMSTHISEKPSNNQLHQQFQDLNQQLVNNNNNISNDDQQQLLFNQQSQQPLFPPLPSQQTHQEISLQAQAMEKIIRDQEIADLKRRRKATKISSMSNFNHIMTPSDKSYILRMQLSALATADPYTEDFYAQIYSTLMRRQQGVLNVGGMAVSVAGGAGRTGMGAGAAKKMRDQIDKIVRAKREKQEEKSSEDPLVGALGKTSTRINARTPRQVLQVSNESSGQAAQDVLSSLPAGASVGPQPALSKRQCMLQIEKLYDLVLQLEHLRRNQPQQIINNNEINADHEDWLNQYNSIAQDVWNGLHVMEPLELSDPHPFISLLSIPKATKLIPRAVRHFNPQQILTLNTLIIACFGQFLTFCDDSRLVESFLACVVPPFMTMVASGSLRLIAGMLALFVERNNIVSVAQSKVRIKIYLESNFANINHYIKCSLVSHSSLYC